MLPTLPDLNSVYNIASRAARSNSVYVSVLSARCQKLFFSRERPLLAQGKLFRDSNGYKQRLGPTSPETKTILQPFLLA